MPHAHSLSPLSQRRQYCYSRDVNRRLKGCQQSFWAAVAGTSIYLVDGECLRDKVDIDMVLGGNPGRYAFIAKGKVLIDKVQTPRDRVATALHELVEYDLMRRKRFSYNKAHDVANRAERWARRRGRLSKQDLQALFDEARTLFLR
jgi:hypothetical protein